MPVLFVPPTLVIPFDAERLVEQRSAMDDFRAQIVSLWQTKSRDEIREGAFRGGRTYDWSESFDGVLQTFYIYPTGIPQRTGQVAQVAGLFKKDSCQLLGGAVVWGSEWAKSQVASDAQNELSRLKQVSARQFSNAKSPVRLSSEGFGYWETALAWISEAYLGEMLASEGLTVHSDLSGLACARNNEPVMKRGHRQVRLVLQGSKPKEPERWPIVRGKVSIIALPLNSNIAAVKPLELKEEPFDPKSLATRVSTQLQPALHELNDRNIRVTKRSGRFVTVERGLAYGLRIGMHLLGPDGAKLHVIRFEKKDGNADDALLLIRKEAKERPIAEGAILQIDATQFPIK